MADIFFILAGLAYLVAVVGGFWLLIVAFKESALWGLASLFVPLAALIFAIKYWQQGAKIPALLGFGGTFVCMAAGVGALLVEPELLDLSAGRDLAARGMAEDIEPNPPLTRPRAESDAGKGSAKESGTRPELSREVEEALGAAYDLSAGVRAPVEFVWTELYARAGQSLKHPQLVGVTGAKIEGVQMDPQTGALLELTFADSPPGSAVRRGTPLLKLSYQADGIVETEQKAKGKMVPLERPGCSLSKAFEAVAAEGISLAHRRGDGRLVWMAIGAGAKVTYMDAQSCVVLRK